MAGQADAVARACRRLEDAGIRTSLFIDPDPAQLAKGEEEFNRFGTVLNDHLKGRETLVGNSVTLADHAVVSWLVHAEAAGLPLDGYAEITRWSGSILGSAPWQQALATIPGG